MQKQIAALFVAKDSIYKTFDFIDCYDIERDAMLYRGVMCVIAHPPCQLWGNMALVNHARWGGDHNKPENDGGKFEFALDCVNRIGGVLEHPKNSRAWSKFGLVKPKGKGWFKSGVGWVCEVWQSAYGHRANKATWLYCTSFDKPQDLIWDRPIGSHQVGFHDQRGKVKNKPTLSKREANATPLDFALELIKIARPALKDEAEKRKNIVAQNTAYNNARCATGLSNCKACANHQTICMRKERCCTFNERPAATVA